MYTFGTLMNMSFRAKISLIDRKDIDDFIDVKMPVALLHAAEYSTERLENDTDVLFNFYLWYKCGVVFSMHDKISVQEYETIVVDELEDLPFYWTQVEPDRYKVDCPKYILNKIEREQQFEYRFRLLSRSRPATQQDEAATMVTRLLIAHLFCNSTRRAFPSWMLDLLDDNTHKTAIHYHSIHKKATLEILPPVDIASQESGNNGHFLLRKPSLPPSLVQRVLEDLYELPFILSSSSSFSDAFVLCRGAVLCLAYSHRFLTVNILSDEIQKCAFAHDSEKPYVLLVITSICPELSKFFDVEGVLRLQQGTYHIFDECMVRYKEQVPVGVFFNGKYCNLKNETTKSTLELHGKTYHMDMDQNYQVYATGNIFGTIQVCNNLQVVIFNQQYSQVFFGNDIYTDLQNAVDGDNTKRLEALARISFTTSRYAIYSKLIMFLIDTGKPEVVYKLIFLTPRIEEQGQNVLVTMDSNSDFESFQMLATEQLNGAHLMVTRRELGVTVERVLFYNTSGANVTKQTFNQVQNEEILIYYILTK
jgi:hypothetical protein